MAEDSKTKIESAIAALEAQRPVLGDAVTETALGPLRQRLTELAAASAPEQQRKLVTLLFADLVGFTALSERLDPEDIHQIQQAYFAAVTQPIVAHGGLVEKYIGDAVLAVFGLPEASEHDPDRAVRAALAMQAELGHLNARLATMSGQLLETDLQMRVGVNTGPVLVTLKPGSDFTVTGDAVNLAARLQTAAAPGAVLISHDTYRHVRGAFDLSPLAPLAVKGKAQPVSVYQVLAFRPRSFRTRKRGVEGVETRMIGRELELAQLHKLWQEVIDEGECHFVTVLAEPGLGKSRLLYEFENWVDLRPEHAQIFRGRARQETQRLPYGLLRDLFAFQFGLLDDDSPPLVQTKVMAGFQAMQGASAEAEMHAHFVGHLLGYGFADSPHLRGLQDDAQQLRDRALLYLIDYFKAAARRNPLLVLLEDLHWSDDSSLDLLLRLALALRGQSLLLLGVARPEFYQRRPHWMEGLDFHTRLDLRPLSTRESRQLVGEVLRKVVQLPDSLRDLVVTNAEGNPFYVEELVKMLVDDGIILTASHAWLVAAEKLTGLHVPSTLTGVLQARLDSLPAAERTLLQQASVVGRVFWDSLVVHLRNGSPANEQRAEVDTGLAALRAKELVYQRELSTLAGAREYIFKHALLREVAYASMLKSDRRAYHAKVAEWLMTQNGERAGELAGLTAEHLSLAEKSEQALVYLRRAGEEAAARYAHSEALDYFGRALALLPAHDLATRWALRLARHRILAQLGRQEGAAEELAALHALASQSGEPDKQAEVALLRAWQAVRSGDYYNASALANSAVGLAQQAGDSGQEALGHVVWTQALAGQGDFSVATEHGQQALALARAVGRGDVQARALRSLAAVAWTRGDAIAARELYEQSLTLFRQVGDRRGEGNLLINFGTALGQLGDLLAARALFEQGLAIAREVGSRLDEGMALNNIGDVARKLGDYSAARSYFRQALAIYREAGARSQDSVAQANLGSVALGLGDNAGAEGWYQLALESARLVNDPADKAVALTGLGTALVGQEHFEKAVPLFQEAITWWRQAERRPLLMEAIVGLTEAYLAHGEPTQASMVAEEILAFLEAGGSFIDTEYGLRNQLICVLVLQANADPRAAPLLEKSYVQLNARARQLPDENARSTFLENVAWHRQIAALWRAAGGQRTERDTI